MATMLDKRPYRSLRSVLGAVVGFAGYQVAIRTQPAEGALVSVLAALVVFFAIEWAGYRKEPAKGGKPAIDAAAEAAVFRAVLIGVIVLVLSTSASLTKAWVASH